MNILDALFPKSCLECGSGGVYICRKCLAKVPRPKQLCPICNRASVDGVTHIRCHRRFGLDGLYSVWNYTGVVRKAILALKYKHAVSVADELSDSLFEIINKNKFLFPKELTMVPIPLYWYRENIRGFNQSIKLSEVIATKIGWNFKPDLLVRKKMKRSQTELGANERIDNVKSVFCLNTNCHLPSTNYILFDDVYTTGSTMKEACKILKRSGIKTVWGLTVAS